MDFCKEYPSGLRLIANKVDNYHTVSFGVMVDVGCVKENEQTNGFSHLIEHMLFKGTAKRSALNISEEIDDMGANVNAFTSKDSTCFYSKSLSEHLEKCIDLISDMYFNASFPEEEFEKEKDVVIEEIKMSNDTPDDVSQDLVSEALFYKQSLGQTILGSAENIKYCDRHSILNFKQKHYISRSSVISVCGRFDFEDLDRWIYEYFENRFDAKYDAEEEPSTCYSSEFLHSFKETEQSHIQLAWGVCDMSSNERFANNLLTSIMGGGMTSRLYQTIREKNGLAYTTYAYPSYYLKGGTFEIYAGLSPVNNTRVCELIFEEIDKLLDSGVTEKELERAKTQAVNALYMSTENNLTLMRLYGRKMLKRGEIFDAEKEAEKYRRVTVGEINDIAAKYLSVKHASSYVGPKINDFSAVSKRLK